MPKQDGGGIVRYSLGGLEADKSYEVRVRAFNFAGGSEYSNTAKAGTLPKGHLFGYTGDTPFRDKTKINAFGTEMVVSDQSIRFFSDYGNNKKGHFWLTEQVPTTAFETEFIVQRTDYQEWDGSPFYGGALQLIFQNSSNQILPSGGDSGYEGIPEAKAKFSFGFGSINSGHEIRLNNNERISHTVLETTRGMILGDGAPYRSDSVTSEVEKTF